MNRGLAAFFTALAIMATPAAAAPAEEGRTVSYQGVVASINAEKGELVIMGNREDREEEGVFQFTVDPDAVVVSKVPFRVHDPDPIYDFRELRKGHRIDLDCVITGDILTVEAIYVYGG